ncbi:A/G-specific adenine glycosylase [Lunatimonas lonarensis]|uniref:Adenine DNA glycosylase n=1 Tax=Lunatimonas lonarensis TaxID=1232681 RepID=R7ZMI7_9BACT|nr:A/G-specific adenine glycosylase [Lunatimonas lonarensis]EON75224.1 A/G-specific adenine glycosylase [Lunatimonas lonarensis]
MIISRFTNQLLAWYPDHKRDLPWRYTRDPYIIWLSEIILQQTRVVQGLPYFELFLQRFPTIFDLAAAAEGEVLRCWQGLGYYSRARNLHACAKEIVRERNGKFPQSYEGLLKLKGVGPYTAAAIASFAFLEPKAVLDGNVYRVLSRYFGVYSDIGSGQGKRDFEKLAAEVLSKEQPDIYNQAIMEFGSLQCTPQQPDCGSCPLVSTCFAFANKAVGELPVKLGRTKVRDRYFHYFYVTCGDEVVINQRRGNDIWRGLVDFPLEESELDERPDVDQSPLLKELGRLDPIVLLPQEPPRKHILSHQRIMADFVEVVVPPRFASELSLWCEGKGYQMIDHRTLGELGKPKLILGYLNEQK